VSCRALMSFRCACLPPFAATISSSLRCALENRGGASWIGRAFNGFAVGSPIGEETAAFYAFL
jgi:hypothetical protein